MKKDIKKKDIFYGVVILVFSFGLLFFCTSSSPRYAINPWLDSNAFFTVGKAMANGMIPYKDIFEQKGPLLYLIHCLAYFISKTSFTGVYIFESLFGAVFAYYIFKTAKLFVKDFPAFITGVLTLTCVVNSPSLYVGDSAEEFCMPFLAFGLYHFVRYFKDSENVELSKKVYLAAGICAGCIAMIKYTVIGLFFGWMAIISIHSLIVKKQVKNAFVNAFVFLGGMILSFIPWIINFGVNGALDDFINAYFVINAIAYSNENSLIVRIMDVPYAYKLQFVRSPFIVITIILGVISAAAFRFMTDGKVYSRLSIPVLFAITSIFVYYGEIMLSYYFLPMIIFVCFLMIAVFRILSNIFAKQKENESSGKKDMLTGALCVVLCAGIIVSAALLNPVSQKIPRDIDQTCQKKISDYISSHNPDGTIICYRKLDAGVYLFNNYTKLFKHFEKQNILSARYSENVEEQKRYVNEREAYYVVCVVEEGELLEDIYNEVPVLTSDYTMVMCLENNYLNAEDLSKELTNHIYLFEMNESA